MRFYLSNALGFFIQLSPCALMIFLPFPQSAFRIRREWILAGTVSATALLSALFPLVLTLFAPNPGGMVGNLMMLFSSLLILAAYVWLVREPLMKKILVFFTVLFYAVTQYYLVNTIRSVVVRIMGEMVVVEPGVGLYAPSYAAFRRYGSCNAAGDAAVRDPSSERLHG